MNRRRFLAAGAATAAVLAAAPLARFAPAAVPASGPCRCAWCTCDQVAVALHQCPGESCEMPTETSAR